MAVHSSIRIADVHELLMLATPLVPGFRATTAAIGLNFYLSATYAIVNRPQKSAIECPRSPASLLSPSLPRLRRDRLQRQFRTRQLISRAISVVTPTVLGISRKFSASITAPFGSFFDAAEVGCRKGRAAREVVGRTRDVRRSPLRPAVDYLHARVLPGIGSRFRSS